MNKLFVVSFILNISYTIAYYYCTCRDLGHCGHLPANCEYSSSFEQLTHPVYCHKMYGLVCVRGGVGDKTCITQGCILPRNDTVVEINREYVKNDYTLEFVIVIIPLTISCMCNIMCCANSFKKRNRNINTDMNNRLLETDELLLF